MISVRKISIFCPIKLRINDWYPSWHGPDCPPVVVIVGDRTVRTVLLSQTCFGLLGMGQIYPISNFKYCDIDNLSHIHVICILRVWFNILTLSYTFKVTSCYLYLVCICMRLQDRIEGLLDMVAHHVTLHPKCQHYTTP